MATLHMLIGIPGSGKTTYAKILEKEKGYISISSDMIRNINPDWEEAKIFPEVYRLCYQYLKKGQDIILDATNITPKVRKRAIDNIENYDIAFKKIAYFFPVDPNECVRRVELRNSHKGERFIPTDIIVGYGENLIAPTLEEGFEEIIVIK